MAEATLAARARGSTRAAAGSSSSARCAALLATLLAGCPAQHPADGLQASQAVQSVVPSAASQASAVEQFRAPVQPNAPVQLNALDRVNALDRSKALGLRVTIEADHWRVETQGAAGSGMCAAPLALPALKRCARSLKLLFPNETAATVAADATVPYRLLIQTLDALRADDQGELFPEFNIAVTAASASSK